LDKAVFLSRMAGILSVERNSLDENHALNGKNWDSVARLSTIALVDELYGVTVPADDLASCSSVGALVELVAKHIA
jgi:acyl carrier protein